ncbi:hypothetical protein DPV78_005325 [Talaromyces pinophilus]|nr:hypothetical protein DPV78_005325 [Talaromyces pinophilus]
MTSRRISGVTPRLAPRTLPYYKKTLDFLRKRLPDQNLGARTSYTTLSIFNILACHAMITLREGTSSFGDNPKLLAEILKSDISISLHSGLTPTFFNDKAVILPYPDLASFLSSQGVAETNSIALFDINAELFQVWKRMSEFCSVINIAADSGQLITTQIFLQSMASIVYPLLGMQFQTSSVHEAIRLTLLAFSSGLFLPWKQLGLSYPYLRSQLKACLLQLDPQKASSAQFIWLLMVSAVSVFDFRDYPWLQSLLFVNINRCDIHCWSAMRNLLKSFLWIGLVHDNPGRSIFESTFRCEEIRPATASTPSVGVAETPF